MNTSSHTKARSPIDPQAGQAAKRDGMAQADDSTDLSWAARCDAAIEEMARTGRPFQAADLVAAGLIDEPDKHQQWGPRFGAARRRHIIARVGSAASKRKKTHSSLLWTWIGTSAEEAAECPAS